jgi:RimJ/RimL family protein N-acetyltransferase
MYMIDFLSKRLSFRSLAEIDWPLFLAMQQDESINQFIRPIEGLDEIEQKFHQRVQPWFFESGDWLTLVIEEVQTKEFVGFIGFYCADSELLRAEVGYILSPPHQGKGYASEALLALINLGKFIFKIHKFTATCDARNLASAQVLTKCGFEQEGLLRSNHRNGDTWVDDKLFGLLT